MRSNIIGGFARSTRAVGLGLLLGLLASCTHRAPVAIATPPAPVATPRPVLPAQYGAIVPPRLGPDGRYVTINSGIDAERTMWHVRAALNVAAIGCRSEADAGLVPAYNALLSSQRAALAGADASVKADFRQRLGARWQDAHDAYMTQLYNFFAQPAAKAAFCTAADGVAAQAAAVPAGGFEAFAQTALPTLEAPFLASYRAVDDYRVALAAWQAGAAPHTEVADASPQLRYGDVSALVGWDAPERSTRLAAR